jgi:hypothetical protein
MELFTFEQMNSNILLSVSLYLKVLVKNSPLNIFFILKQMNPAINDFDMFIKFYSFQIKE